MYLLEKGIVNKEETEAVFSRVEQLALKDPDYAAGRKRLIYVTTSDMLDQAIDEVKAKRQK